MHNFSSDFYGSVLKTCIVNYIRPEQSYDSLGKQKKTVVLNLTDNLA